MGIGDFFKNTWKKIKESKKTQDWLAVGGAFALAPFTLGASVTYGLPAYGAWRLAEQHKNDIPKPPKEDPGDKFHDTGVEKTASGDNVVWSLNYNDKDPGGGEAIDKTLYSDAEAVGRFFKFAHPNYSEPSYKVVVEFLLLGALTAHGGTSTATFNGQKVDPKQKHPYGDMKKIEYLWDTKTQHLSIMEYRQIQGAVGREFKEWYSKNVKERPDKTSSPSSTQGNSDSSSSPSSSPTDQTETEDGKWIDNKAEVKAYDKNQEINPDADYVNLANWGFNYEGILVGAGSVIGGYLVSEYLRDFKPLKFTLLASPATSMVASHYIHQAYFADLREYNNWFSKALYGVLASYGFTPSEEDGRAYFMDMGAIGIVAAGYSYYIKKPTPLYIWGSSTILLHPLWHWYFRHEAYKLMNSQWEYLPLYITGGGIVGTLGVAAAFPKLGIPDSAAGPIVIVGLVGSGLGGIGTWVWQKGGIINAFAALTEDAGKAVWHAL